MIKSQPATNEFRDGHDKVKWGKTDWEKVRAELREANKPKAKKGGGT